MTRDMLARRKSQSCWLIEYTESAALTLSLSQREREFEWNRIEVRGLKIMRGIKP
jgi:hypothetical protein